MKTEIILDALKTIQQVCRDYSNCGICPLRNDDGDCTLLTLAPVNWEIGVEKYYWKAFKE